MAEMALGYGSEYQLLRFLGHHRDEFYDAIRRSINEDIDEDIHWIDYPYNSLRHSGDGEFIGVNCFEGRLDSYPFIESQWEKFWPPRGNSMNWDGVFIVHGIWFFVEAKANEKEAYQKCEAKPDSSCKIIDAAFENTKKWLGIKNDIDWRKTDCYQLANRLAFMYFCNVICKIPAKLLYVGFINGYPCKNVTNEKQWKSIWEREFKTLGIGSENVKSLLYHVYPNCLGDDTKLAIL